MKNIRIGNDIKVIWSIFDKEGNPYPLVKDIKLTLKCGNYSLDIEDYSIEDNTISFIFYGMSQINTGTYMLTLVENNDEIGMQTLDFCKVFKLVASSCEETNEDTLNPHIETIELDSKLNLAFVSGGSSEPVMTTYEELFQLYENNNLVPGQKYRFPYTLKLNENDNYKSAGHVFDIIITAISNGHFDTNVVADFNADDTYIADNLMSANLLTALKIEYCFDAREFNNPYNVYNINYGVITRMTDSFGNSFPYDFMNMQFKAYVAYDFFNLPYLYFADDEVFFADGEDVWCYTFSTLNYNYDEGYYDVYNNNPIFVGNIYNIVDTREFDTVWNDDNFNCVGGNVFYVMTEYDEAPNQHDIELNSTRYCTFGYYNYDNKFNGCYGNIVVSMEKCDNKYVSTSILNTLYDNYLYGVDNSFLKEVGYTTLEWVTALNATSLFDSKIINSGWGKYAGEPLLSILLNYDYGEAMHIFASSFLNLNAVSTVKIYDSMNITVENTLSCNEDYDNIEIIESYNIRFGVENFFEILHIDNCDTICVGNKNGENLKLYNSFNVNIGNRNMQIYLNKVGDTNIGNNNYITIYGQNYDNITSVNILNNSEVYLNSNEIEAAEDSMGLMVIGLTVDCSIFEYAPEETDASLNLRNVTINNSSQVYIYGNVKYYMHNMSISNSGINDVLIPYDWFSSFDEINLPPIEFINYQAYDESTLAQLINDVYWAKVVKNKVTFMNARTEQLETYVLHI